MRKGFFAVMSVVAALSSADAQSLTTDSMTPMIDRIMTNGLRRFEIAGAAVVVIRDGAFVFKRGFGLADVQRRYEVDPDTTVFHVASITKLLTAFATLQLVEKGKLSLDDDIRSSIGGKLPAGWEEPVTLRELLTHSAGLDTRWIGMATRFPGDVRTLGEYLGEHLPPIRGQPGHVIRYSNHGYAVAGLRVEQAAEIPWARVIDEQVLAPLQMSRSYASPRQPPPAHATPYRYRRDTTPEPMIFEHLAPGGAVHASAADIARLLMSLLDTSTVLLSMQSKNGILTPQHHLAGIEGFGFGTFRFPHPRIEAMSMGGEVPGFSTRILLVPSHHLGAVVMVNRKDPSLAVALFDSLLATLPDTAADPRADHCLDAGATRQGVDPTGNYRSNVEDRSSFLRVGTILGPSLSITQVSDSTIVVTSPFDDRASQWRRVGTNRWSSGRGECLAIDLEGRTPFVMVSTRLAGPVMLHRVRWWESSAATPLAALFSLMLLAACLAVVGWKVLRRTADAYGEVLPLLVAVPIVHIIFAVLYATGLYRLAIGFDDRFAFGIPGWYSVTLWLPLVSLVLTALLVIRLSKSWKKGLKVVTTITTVASVALLMVLFYWRAVPLWLGTLISSS